MKISRKQYQDEIKEFWSKKCEKLQAELEKHRWIFVSERLPTLNDRYNNPFQNEIHDDGTVDVLAEDEYGMVQILNYFPKMHVWNGITGKIVRWKPICK